MCKKVWRTCLSEVESRTQDSRPRPRTQKNPRPRPRTAFPRTDTLEAKDRNARGQGQGPRTQAQVLSKKKKKKVFTKIFQAISTKKRFPKNFSSAQGQGLQNLSLRTPPLLFITSSISHFFKKTDFEAVSLKRKSETVEYELLFAYSLQCSSFNEN